MVMTWAGLRGSATVRASQVALATPLHTRGANPRESRRPAQSYFLARPRGSAFTSIYGTRTLERPTTLLDTRPIRARARGPAHCRVDTVVPGWHGGRRLDPRLFL